MTESDETTGAKAIGEAAGGGDPAGGSADRDVRELRTAATPEEVWEAWAVPERLRQWFPEDARGEPVAGGELVHVWTTMGFEVPHRVLAAEPGRYLSLEGRNPAGLAFRQEIVIERQGDETVLRLIHSGFDAGADWDDEVFADIDSGWKLVLATLRLYLEHHFGEDRRTFTLIRPAAYDQEALQRRFREPDGLAGWLTRSGSLAGLAAGDPVRLTLHDGSPLTGRLLADSGRELALSWDEIGGVLHLKGFKLPGARAVGLFGSVWGNGTARVPEVEGTLTAAVERLAALLAAG